MVLTADGGYQSLCQILPPLSIAVSFYLNFRFEIRRAEWFCALLVVCDVVSQLCRCFHLKSKLLINPLRVHGSIAVTIPSPQSHPFFSFLRGDDFEFPMTILPNPQKHRGRREVRSRESFSVFN